MGLIRRWWPAVLLVILGVAGGSGLAMAQAPTYTAEARLVVGESTLSANMIPGFALATQEIASNYARFVTKAPVLHAVPAKDAKLIKTVSASPIPSSNIVRVEATALSQSAALAAAQVASTGLVRQVADLSPEQSAANTLTRLGKLSRDMTATQEAVSDAQSEIGEYRNSSETGADERLDKARENLARANARLSTLQAQQNALNALYQSQVGSPPQSSLQLVNQARVVGNDLMSRLQLYALGGAGIGGMIGLLLVRRRDRMTVLASRPPVPTPGSPERPGALPADAMGRGVVDLPQIMNLGQGYETPTRVPSPAASPELFPVTPSDSTQPLDSGGRRTEWDGVPSGRRRASDSDDWPARLRR